MFVQIGAVLKFERERKKGDDRKIALFQKTTTLFTFPLCCAKRHRKYIV
jgi:hypothetical protein